MTRPNVENPYRVLFERLTTEGKDPKTHECFATHNPADEEIFRQQADVGIGDRNLVRGICPQQGVYTFVLSTLFIKFCAELRAKGIVDVTREGEFLSAVTDCKIVFPSENLPPTQLTKKLATKKPLAAVAT